LIPLKGKSIRPTSQRLREYIFNWLGQFLDGDKVLDCFAGSGAFGIEALSRGASLVHFVEISSDSCSIVRKNLSKLKISSSLYQVQKSDFWDMIDEIDEEYNIIFIDPPYADYSLQKGKAIEQLILNNLSPKGVCLLEMSVKTDMSFFPFLIKNAFVEKKMGNSKLIIIEKG